MIKLYIFADSYKHFEIPVKEYEKRLGKSILVVKLKPSKNTNENLVIKEETNIIKDKLVNEKGFKIALNPVGKTFKTSDFFEFIESKKMNYGDIIFVIGGAFGFDYEDLNGFIDFNLSLSYFTMPHSLALLVILEQTYRLEMIKKGTSYDK